jgi:hypothetical protein
VHKIPLRIFKEQSSDEFVLPLPAKSPLEVKDDELETSQADMDEVEYLLREKPPYEAGSLIHVYSDSVYNRTSFHLAGTPGVFLEVANELLR